MAKNQPFKKFKRNVRRLESNVGFKAIQHVLEGLFDYDVYDHHDPLHFEQFVALRKGDGLSISQGRRGEAMGLPLMRNVFINNASIPKLKRAIERYEREVKAAKDLRRADRAART